MNRKIYPVLIVLLLCLLQQPLAARHRSNPIPSRHLPQSIYLSKEILKTSHGKSVVQRIILMAEKCNLNVNYIDTANGDGILYRRKEKLVAEIKLAGIESKWNVDKFIRKVQVTSSCIGINTYTYESDL